MEERGLIDQTGILISEELGSPAREKFWFLKTQLPAHG